MRPMSRPRRTALLLRLLLAACALLAGLDLHVLEFGSAPALAAQHLADGSGAQIHDNDCQHREHIPPDHDGHECTLCKAGATRATGVLPRAVVHAQPQRVATHAASAAAHTPSPLAAGNLGARGPPATDA